MKGNGNDEKPPPPPSVSSTAPAPSVAPPRTSPPIALVPIAPRGPLLPATAVPALPSVAAAPKPKPTYSSAKKKKTPASAAATATAASSSKSSVPTPSVKKDKAVSTQISIAAANTADIKPAAPTSSVESILSSLNLPPTIGTGLIASSASCASKEKEVVLGDPLLWRASDPIRNILTSPVASLQSRRPTAHWSNKFDLAKSVSYAKIARGDAVRAAFDAAALAGLRAILSPKLKGEERAMTAAAGGNGATSSAPVPLVAAMQSIAKARDTVMDDVLTVDREDNNINKRRRSISPVPGGHGSAAKRAKTEGGKAADAGADAAVSASDINAEAAAEAATPKSTAKPIIVKRAGYFGKGRPGRPKGGGSPALIEAGSASIVGSGGGSSPGSRSISPMVGEGSSAAAASAAAAAAAAAAGECDSSRTTAARAILCAAANLAFKELTPDFVLEGQDKADGVQGQLKGAGQIDELDIPQNTHTKAASSLPESASSNAAASSTSNAEEKDAVNMGAVLMQARTYADRAIRQARGAARRSDARGKWRVSCAAGVSALEQAHLESHGGSTGPAATMRLPLLGIGNPFARGPGAGGNGIDGPNWISDDDEDAAALSKPSFDPAILLQSKTDHWSKSCLPRLLSIMGTGAGHAVIHDTDWANRPGRIADLLRATDEKCGTRFGPHLVITTMPDLDKFRVVFEQMNLGLVRVGLAGDEKTGYLSPTSLVYEGSHEHRRLLRLRHFATLSNVAFSSDAVPSPPFDVILTTYSTFLSDYPHFTRIPFHAVVLDDGVSWLSLAANDGNGGLAKAYEGGMWSRADHHAGGAGIGIGAGGIADTGNLSFWDFGLDDGGYVAERAPKKIKKDGKEYEAKPPERSGPSLLLGLTARHRVLVAPTMSVSQDDTLYTAPATALLSLLLPQFSDVVKEEWDRARMQQCPHSMGHIKRLLCRSMGVHMAGGSGDARDMMTLAMDSLSGKLSVPENNRMTVDTSTEPIISTDALVSASMIAKSRYQASVWLRKGSHIRTELGKVALAPILKWIKARSKAGYVCEEIVPAAALTTSGAFGAVVGGAAYRLAVRCGRTFGSEPGLRQHIAASHAPPGTWVCRACGDDCSTSQWRTHHERTCGNAQEAPGSDKKAKSKSRSGASSLGGMPPTVGQSGKKSKASGGKTSTAPPRDADGSFCVPSWRGVWVNPAGKHFVKIDGKKLTDSDFNVDTKKKDDEQGGDMLTKEKEGASEAKLFDSAEQAAKAHDDVAKTRELQTVELNFKADGTRIVYQDNFGAPGDLEVLGTDTSSVVPALSVINIRDLPPNVKPLLRDPRQTSRTGGQQKRHVYAYRGVCRQARKGHDRWQSQISYAGTNHYLGTFDSEWDAAAIYAWAHLILYGEEATKQAQKEGEEAAAAYEQEKKDIAAGLIPPPTAKPKAPSAKKKPGPKRKRKKKAEADDKHKSDQKATKSNKQAEPAAENEPVVTPLGKKRATDALATTPNAPKQQADITHTKPLIDLRLRAGVKVASAAENLARRKEIAEKDNKSLIKEVSGRIIALREKRLNETAASAVTRKVRGWSACIPVKDLARIPSGCAMLVGLDASDFSWDVDSFLASVQVDLGDPLTRTKASESLNEEYAEGGFNESFRTVLQTSVCTLGRAGRYLEDASVALGLGSLEIGGSAGHIECNIGGTPYSCSESAARMVYCPTATSEYQIQATDGDDDIVTLNGQRITADAGPYPLRDQDICSVGTRVFMFLLAPK